MKTTPLTAHHIALGAKMTEFAGYNMPVSYSGITDEHKCVRQHVGIFDVSHMGEFIVRGKEAAIFLQNATSNDVAKLEPGQAQYSCMPNNEGGIVDDLIVYRLDDVPAMTKEGEQSYMLVVNASNEQKDWDWLQGIAANFDVQMTNISDQTGLLAVQGPKATEALQGLTEVDLKSIPFYNYKRGSFAGCPNVIISATGYTGAGGFELYAANDDIVTIWEAILKDAEKHQLKPCGLGARDTLRLEMGYCLYGNDLNDSTSPIEAGLGWITKLKKVEDFPSKHTFVQQRAEGVERKLVGFVVNDRRVPRNGYVIESADGMPIGTVTSGSQSPILEQPIGMGYVNTGFAAPGTTLYIAVGSKKLEAVVKKPPFIES